jgi:hypothetical protein
MNKLLLIAAVVAAAYFALVQGPGTGTDPTGRPEQSVRTSDTRSARNSGNIALEDAISQRASDRQVQGEGVVVKTLSDDNSGSRHQRFIVRLSGGHTVLIAHNIDLAPRIDALREGDSVAFYGEYEWNPKGGVIHWTHHDPQNRHAAGWIKHDGQTYQ